MLLGQRKTSPKAARYAMNLAKVTERPNELCTSEILLIVFLMAHGLFILTFTVLSGATLSGEQAPKSPYIDRSEQDNLLGVNSLLLVFGQVAAVVFYIVAVWFTRMSYCDYIFTTIDELLIQERKVPATIDELLIQQGKVPAKTHAVLELELEPLVYDTAYFSTRPRSVVDPLSFNL